MKFFIFTALVSAMTTMGSFAHAYSYQTRQNGTSSYGNSPYTDPSFTKLSDSNLGSATAIDSAYVHYTTSTYPVSVSAVSVVISNSVTVYALKNTSAGIDLPTQIDIGCPKPFGGFTTSATFVSSNYPDNTRVALVVPTGNWGSCLAVGVTLTNANSSYTAFSEVVFQ